ncbi:hypothetical protein CF65_02271 [Aggregatibacter actinomycetemcomitans HK1651]|nr:hypothetical protein CF65_02271 [Aggregatibacter actinomycetemcomitans HK1651]
MLLDKEDKITLISGLYLICAHYRIFLRVFINLA